MNGHVSDMSNILTTPRIEPIIYVQHPTRGPYFGHHCSAGCI